MENIVKFLIIILAFVFVANWIALQLKAYELLSVFSIITFVGTFTLLLIFTIKIYKSTKKAKEENINIKKYE